MEAQENRMKRNWYVIEITLVTVDLVSWRLQKIRRWSIYITTFICR